MGSHESRPHPSLLSPPSSPNRRSLTLRRPTPRSADLGSCAAVPAGEVPAHPFSSTGLGVCAPGGMSRRRGSLHMYDVRRPIGGVHRCVSGETTCTHVLIGPIGTLPCPRADGGTCWVGELGTEFGGSGHHVDCPGRVESKRKGGKWVVTCTQRGASCTSSMLHASSEALTWRDIPSYFVRPSPTAPSPRMGLPDDATRPSPRRPAHGLCIQTPSNGLSRRAVPSHRHQTSTRSSPQIAPKKPRVSLRPRCNAICRCSSWCQTLCLAATSSRAHRGPANREAPRCFYGVLYPHWPSAFRDA